MNLESGGNMEFPRLVWGGKKQHDHTFKSALFYRLSKLAYRLAPQFLTRLVRVKGFAVKPFRLTAKQRALQLQARTFSLEFENNQIKVFEWGSGPVIVLVHGWGGRALQLDAFVPALLQQGYRVVAFDHKGHGESSSRCSSYLEIIRGTQRVFEHYAQDLVGVVAHSIGANATFKVSEQFDRGLKLAVVAPMEHFPQWLEKMRSKLGIYEVLFAHVIASLEADTGLSLAQQCQLDFALLNRHEVLLVHDKLDRINHFSASQEIHQNLPGSQLLPTEMLGHARILANAAVVERVAAHFKYTG
jgi:hypothetical protein